MINIKKKILEYFLDDIYLKDILNTENKSIMYKETFELLEKRFEHGINKMKFISNCLLAILVIFFNYLKSIESNLLWLLLVIIMMMIINLIIETCFSNKKILIIKSKFFFIKYEDEGKKYLETTNKFEQENSVECNMFPIKTFENKTFENFFLFLKSNLEKQQKIIRYTNDIKNYKRNSTPHMVESKSITLKDLFFFKKDLEKYLKEKNLEKYLKERKLEKNLKEQYLKEYLKEKCLTEKDFFKVIKELSYPQY